MKELAAGTRCTVIGWGKKEDKNREFILAGIFISSEFGFEGGKISFLVYIDRNSISV